jgi:hypothetical protein
LPRSPPPPVGVWRIARNDTRLLDSLSVFCKAKSMHKKLTSPIKLLKQAWNIGMSNKYMKYFLLLGVLQNIFPFIHAVFTTPDKAMPQLVSMYVHGSGVEKVWILGVILLVICFGIVIIPWFTAFSYELFRDAELGHAIVIKKRINTSRSKVFHYISTYLMQGALIVLGFVLLIIPGIMLAVYFQFALFIAVFEPDKDPLKQSKALVHGKWWALVVRMLFGSLVYGIPSLILRWINPLLPYVWYIYSPIFSFYGYLVYRDFVRVSGLSATHAKK